MRIGDVREYGFEPNGLDLTNFFEVQERQAANGSVDTFFNLNEGVTVEGISDVLSDSVHTYRCRSGDNLRFISFREYGTTHYWWLIAKINGIEDAFEVLEPGRELYLLSKEHMSYIVNLIMDRKSSDA